MKRVLAEALRRLQRHRWLTAVAAAFPGAGVSAPPPLPRTLGQPLAGVRVLLLGTCGLELLARSPHGVDLHVDHMLMESFSHSEVPNVGDRPRDLAIVALTLRHILGEAAGVSQVGADLLFARLQTASAAEALCADCKPLIEAKVRQLHAALGSTPVLFTTFIEPSFDDLGLLRAGDRRRSPIEVVRRLNAMLQDAVAALPGAHVLDVNLILNQVGRAHLQDDALMSASHGSYLPHGIIDLDAGRIVQPTSLSQTYRIKSAERAYARAFWAAVADSLKIIGGVDPIKLLIVDLDDTLWRGVAGEADVEPWARIEGWPIGLMEALLVFKARGGLLAICSKNDREPTLRRLQEIWRGAVTPQDFAVIKINWSPKSQNVEDILREINVLPDHVAILDDNPREVDEVRARFPEIRVLGFNPYDWRRIVLRAPEMQTTVTTAESLQRTQMVQARLERESLCRGLSRDEWLASLQCRQRFVVMSHPSSPLFPRSLELLNKTNQFNTTGQRWSAGDLIAFLGGGGVAVATALKDRTVDNGFVGLALVKAGEIVQVVLSCRVFGLGVEINLGRAATVAALTQASVAQGHYLDTGRNAACHDLFDRLGFRRVGDSYVAETPCAPAPWIEVANWDL